jgi:hypothetical protein
MCGVVIKYPLPHLTMYCLVATFQEGEFQNLQPFYITRPNRHPELARKFIFSANIMA